MILLPHERNSFQEMTEDVYNALMCDSGNTDASCVVPLICRVEAYRREIRLDYSQIPEGVLQTKIGMELVAFKIWLTWGYMKSEIPTATFDDAKCVAMGYVPDVYRDHYGYQRVTNGRENKTPVVKFRVSDHNYVSLTEMLAHIKADIKISQGFKLKLELVTLRYLRDIKLALFYRLIKREELTDYLDKLIYGDKPKANEI